MTDLYGDPHVGWEEANAANEDGEAEVRDQMLEAERQNEEDRRTRAGRRTLAEGGYHTWAPITPEWPYDIVPGGRPPRTPVDLYETLGAVAEALPVAMREQFVGLVRALTWPSRDLPRDLMKRTVDRWRDDTGYHTPPRS